MHNLQLKNKYIEKNHLKLNEEDKNIEKDGQYYRKLFNSYRITINDFTHTFNTYRYYDEEKTYIKTINIIRVNKFILETKEFYISFTNQTINYNDQDILKYSYGVFSKYFIKNENKEILKLHGIEIQFLLDEYKNDPIILYSSKFRLENPNYKYIGINLDQKKYGYFTIGTLVNKSPIDSNCYLFEKIDIINKEIYPNIYLKQYKDINEDDEIIYDNEIHN